MGVCVCEGGGVLAAREDLRTLGFFFEAYGVFFFKIIRKDDRQTNNPHTKLFYSADKPSFSKKENSIHFSPSS